MRARSMCSMYVNLSRACFSSVAEAEEHAEEAQELRAECVALRRRVQVMLQEQEDNGIRIDAVHKYLAE